MKTYYYTAIVIAIFVLMCYSISQAQVVETPYKLKSNSSAVLYKDNCFVPDSFVVKKVTGHFGVRILLDKNLQIYNFFIFDFVLYRDSSLVHEYSNYDEKSPIYKKNIFTIDSIDYPYWIDGYIPFLKKCLNSMVFRKRKGFKRENGYYTLIVYRKF